MFLQNINGCIQRCKDELLNSDNPQIKQQLKSLKKSIPAQDWDDFLSATINQLMGVVLIGGLDDEDVIEEGTIEILKQTAHSAKEATKSLTLKVELENLEEEYYRIMEVPYLMTFADLAYIVMAAFHCEGYHLYSVKYKNQTFMCPAMEDDDYAEDILSASDSIIIDSNLRKNSKIEVLYDFGDCFNFKVTVLSVNKNKNIYLMDNAHIIEGKGFGIWEDDHEFMRLYYGNPDEFFESIEDQGFEEDMFPLDDEFDLSEANDVLLIDFRGLKEIYESPDDDDYEYDDEFDDNEDFYNFIEDDEEE
ncbi:MAG: plasmid pRiA4b ORF-3 family protein [Erysipelotrichaceae bacterium]|nr:plasmid pRiA4b ORF-3 family protein [Erysipelotrichaceae bacterium]